MTNKKPQTPLDTYDYFYCDKCKAIQPLRNKPAILERHPRIPQGKTFLCEGSFVCDKCGFKRSIRCDVCQKVQPVEIEEPYMENATHEFLSADVLCGHCRHIIATLYTRMPTPAA